MNREYILKRTKDIESLIAEIEDLEGTLKSKNKVLKIIIKELEEVIKKYGKERRTEIISFEAEEQSDEEVELDNSPVTLFFTKDGYFKR